MTRPLCPGGMWGGLWVVSSPLSAVPTAVPLWSGCVSELLTGASFTVWSELRLGSLNQGHCCHSRCHPRPLASVFIMLVASRAYT